MTRILRPQESSIKAARGFSLVEMAIGMLVLALLLGSILVPLSAQVEQRKITETQKALDEIREALLGYAIAQGHLPCPDRMSGAGSNNGEEDRAGINCSVEEGNLPWVTLGTPGTDSWGNRFRYRISPVFAETPPNIAFGTVSGVDVCGDSACATRVTVQNDGPPALIISHGRNGRGAINGSNNAQNPLPPAGSDELENTDGDTLYVSRVQSAEGSALGEFDDLFAWVPRSVLLNRLVASGRLP
jgi:prepilin-type N-terminal cleavage/methylation domain-containing protein